MNKNNFKKALLLFIVAIWVNMLTEYYDNHCMFYHGNFHFSFTVRFIGRRALAQRSTTSWLMASHSKVAKFHCLHYYACRWIYLQYEVAMGGNLLGTVPPKI